MELVCPFCRHVPGFFRSVRDIIVNVGSAVGAMHPPIALVSAIHDFLGYCNMCGLCAREFLGSPDAMKLMKHFMGICAVVGVGRCPENGRKITGLTISAREYDFKNETNKSVTIEVVLTPHSTGCLLTCYLLGPSSGRRRSGSSLRSSCSGASQMRTGQRGGGAIADKMARQGMAAWLDASYNGALNGASMAYT